MEKIPASHAGFEMRVRIISDYYIFDDHKQLVPLHHLWLPNRPTCYLAGNILLPKNHQPIATISTYPIQDFVTEYNVKPNAWIVTECSWYKLVVPNKNYVLHCNTMDTLM